MSTCGVYEIVVKHTGERYIGSSVDLKGRWRRHWRNLQNGKHWHHQLQTAYDADPDSVEFRILEECDKSIVRAREQHYLNTTECINKHSNCLKAPVEMSAAGKQKISDAQKGKKHSEAHRKAAAAGKYKPVYVKWANGAETVFESRKAAWPKLGLKSKSALQNWLLGKSTTYTKYGIAEIRYV